MKPRSKSEWIRPAASGAVAPRRTSQARVSSSPVVKKVWRSSSRQAAPTTWSRPERLTPYSAGQADRRGPEGLLDPGRPGGRLAGLVLAKVHHREHGLEGQGGEVGQDPQLLGFPGGVAERLAGV